MTPTTRSPLGWLLAALGLLATPALAPAQTFWVPTTGGDWSVPGNWSPTTVPDAAGAWAQFALSGTGSQTVNVDGTFTVGRIMFGFTGTSGSSNFAHTLSGGGLIMNNGGSESIVERSRTDGDSVILTPLTIAGNDALTLRNAGFSNTGVVALNTLTIASLTGTNSTVTINPTGTSGAGVVVIQSGSYGGITHVQGGVLRADEGVGLPANTSLRLNGGMWEVTQAITMTRSLGTGAGNIQLLGATGFSALDAGGSLRVQLNGGTGQVQWGSADFNPTILGFGRNASASNESYSFENAIDLNGATRTIAASNKAVVFFGGVISNSSATPAGLTITRANGAGTVVLSGTNTYTGTTTVQLGAVLRARDNRGLPSASNLFLNGGTLEYLDFGTFNRAPGAGAGEIRMLGASGFAAWGGPLTVLLGAGPVLWGSASFSPSRLEFGSPNATGLVDFQTGIDLNGGTRFITYWDRSSSTTDSALISGVISNSTGTPVLVFGGNGTISLSAANTYAGDTYVFDGVGLTGNTLRLTGTGSFANSPRVTLGAGRFLDVTGLTGGANYNTGASRFMVASGQTLAGMGTVVGDVLVGPHATIRGGSPSTGLNDPTGQLTIDGSLRLIGSVSTAGSTLAVDLDGTSSSDATVSRVAVIGAGNAWDFVPAAGDPVTIQLLNDQNLSLNQPYTYIIGSSAGGFTRNGTPVTSYSYGTDFDIVSSNFQVFTNVSLTVDGSNNLVLGFVPAPVTEPALVLAIGAAGLALVRSRRKGKPE